MSAIKLSAVKSNKIADIKKAIDDNIASIKGLMEQANRLANVIEMHKDEGNLKDELQPIKNQIDQALDTLMKSTNSLFDSYINVLLKD